MPTANPPPGLGMQGCVDVTSSDWLVGFHLSIHLSIQHVEIHQCKVFSFGWLVDWLSNQLATNQLANQPKTLKINQDRVQDLSKINQKSIQNPSSWGPKASKIGPGGGLERSREALGGVLGTSWPQDTPRCTKTPTRGATGDRFPPPPDRFPPPVGGQNPF